MKEILLKKRLKILIKFKNGEEYNRDFVKSYYEGRGIYL